MFRKVDKRNSRYLAKLVTGDRAPCAFCHRDVDDEVTFGKLYAIGDIHCHYLCALLSCCLVQKGPEEEGLFGFMYKDIKAELERSQKHKCSYCGCGGANLGCSVTSCRKQFHLPCGREKNAVSLFYGSYKSFCQVHAPKQRIPEHIMCKAKLRMKDDKKKIVLKDDVNQPVEEDIVCVICYETVDAFPTVNTFWPPCCGKDAWIHRNCLQRMALSAGMHYLKCPLCNDKENFYEAVENQGYYVPDRDAAWELEQNAFAEIYERPLVCTAEVCKCPNGRSHDSDQGMWDITLCLLCGSVGAHAQCIGASEKTRYVCLTCTPAAPHDLQALIDNIEKLILEEQANSPSTSVRHGPVMPSRMSLRRTKARQPLLDKPSSSRERRVKTECASPAPSPSIESSRQQLNLGTPRRINTTGSYNTQSPRTNDSPKSIHTPSMERSPIKLTGQSSNEPYKYVHAKSPMKIQNSDSCKNVESKLLSPTKLLEQSFKDKVVSMGSDAILDEQVEMLRRRFNKPRPLSKKKEIINDILSGSFDDFDNLLKQKDPIREWCSPKKCITEQMEIQTAGDNSTETAGNTVENKENGIHETPRKSRVNPETSTPNKVSTPSFKDNDLEDITTNKDEIDNEKQVVGDNHNDVDENLDQIKEIHNKIEEKHTEVEENNLIDAGNHNKIDETREIEAMSDESSNSNFQLHPDFIAETLSDESITFQSPKQKTIEMKNSSLEISEQNHSVSIDVIKINDRSDISQANGKEKSPFQFSRLDTDSLGEGILGLDLETFKDGYLSEIDVNYKCCFNHKHDKYPFLKNFRTVIDFAIDAHLRKVENKPKKRKFSESSLVLSCDKTQAKKKKMRNMSENLNSTFSSDDFEIKKDFTTVTNKVDTDKVTDKHKTAAKDKRNERKNSKRRHDKKQKQILEKHVQKSNKYKLKTENRNLLDRKLESKKRAKNGKVEYEKRIISKDEHTVKDQDASKAGLLKEKQENIDNKKPENKEKCKDKNVEDKRTKELGNHDDIKTERKENCRDTNVDDKKQSNSKDKHTKPRDEKKELSRKDEQNENKEQIDKRKRIHRKKEKRMKDKTRDGKDGRVKYKHKSNDERTRKDKVIDEKTNSRKEKKHKLVDKTNLRKEKHKNPDKYRIIKHDRNSEKRVKNRKTKDGQNIEVTIDSSKGKSDKKSKTKLSITNNEKDNISVKIQWKKKLLSLKIKSKKDKTEKIESDNSKFKQYVLQYFSEVTPREVLVKPEKEVSPPKRKYVKQEKTPDNLKQTSIQKFFKVKSD